MKHHRRKSSRVGRQYQKSTDIRREASHPVSPARMNRILKNRPGVRVTEIVRQRGMLVYNLVSSKGKVRSVRVKIDG